jgi:hypothetical protein
MSGTNPLLRCFVPEIRSSALKGTTRPVHLILKSGKVPDDIIRMMLTTQVQGFTVQKFRVFARLPTLKARDLRLDFEQ